MMLEKEQNPLASISAEKLVSLIADNLKLPAQSSPDGIDLYMRATALVVAVVPFFIWSRDNLGAEPSTAALIEAFVLPSVVRQGRNPVVVLPDHIQEGTEAYLKVLAGGMEVTDPVNTALILERHEAAMKMVIFTLGTLFPVLAESERIAQIEERLGRVVPQKLLDADIDDWISAPN
jgi:hypothetical protein